MSKIPADHFIRNIAANVDNKKLDDKQFREFIRNTLPIVEYEEPKEELNHTLLPVTN